MRLESLPIITVWNQKLQKNLEKKKKQTHETKQHATKESMGQWRDQRGNQRNTP